MKKSQRLKQLWENITPEMMTEEETGSDNDYIRHRQSWRSQNFNALMDKLDEAKSGRTLAKQRKLGDNIVRPSPPSAKKWMLVHNHDSDEDSPLR